MVDISSPEIVQVEYADDLKTITSCTRRANNSTTEKLFQDTNGGFKLWLQNPNKKRRTHYVMSLNPATVPKDTFNLFVCKLPYPGERPTPLSAEELAVIEPILQHIKEVLAAGDESVNDYVIKWLAFGLQKPGQKTKVILSFFSLQGAGKGVIVNELLKNMYGKAHVVTNNIHHVVGNFNHMTANALIVVVDEAMFTHISEWQTMKSMVTEGTMTVEQKHKDSIQVN